jgi:hypothetical protein
MMRQKLTMRALIERNLTPGLDAYGNALEATWGTLYAAQACYYYQPAARRAEQAGARNLNAYADQLLVPLACDVLEADRINGITDRRGLNVCASVFNVIAIVRKPDHLLLTLEQVT